MPAEGSAFEGVIGDLSARFAGIEPARFGEEVDYSLKALVQWFGTDRASFLEFSPDHATLNTTHAWAKRPEVEPRPPQTVWQNFPWYFEQLQRGRDVVFGNLPGDFRKRVL